MSVDKQELNQLVQALQATVAGIETSTDPDEARKSALKEARDVVTALEKPSEVIHRWANEMLAGRMSLRVGVDLRIFHILSRSDRPLTSAELAAQTKAEELLIIRIMRVLCSFSFAKETNVQTYEATPYTHAMTDEALEGGILITYDYSATAELPKYYKAKGYHCPTDPTDCPFQFAHNTDLTYFRYIHQSPSGMKAFNAFMGAIRSGRKFWADWYDVDGRVLDGFSYRDGDALLIDIGGGNGHDLEGFLQKYPRSAGHLVLQDLPAVIDALPELSSGIKPMSYDFFTEQPVRGVRVYFMHFCLHNWSDDKARAILQQMKAAMNPGYSKILLNEAVIPDRDCPAWFSTQDINMMAILGGIQRSRRQWAALIESVGLECVNIWTSPFQGDSEGIIEATLKS